MSGHHRAIVWGGSCCSAIDSQLPATMSWFVLMRGSVMERMALVLALHGAVVLTASLVAGLLLHTAFPAAFLLLGGLVSSR